MCSTSLRIRMTTNLREHLREQDLSRVSRILCLTVIKSRLCHHNQQQAHMHGQVPHKLPVKRRSASRKSTLPISNQPKDLSDAPARVRWERHSERPHQRRVLEDPDGDEIMFGEIQVNTERVSINKRCLENARSSKLGSCI